jgi:hypothetical protein
MVGSYLNQNKDKIVFFPSRWFPKVNYPNEIAFEGSNIIDLETFGISKYK